MSLIKKIFAIFILSLLAIVAADSVAATDRDGDDMLVISSYSPYYKWSNRIVHNLEVLVTQDYHKQMSTISLPLVAVNSMEGLDSLLNVLHKVLKDRRPKSVALVGSGSFIFCEDIDSIFPDIPMILIGGHEYTSSKQQVVEKRIITSDVVLSTEQLHEKYNITSQCMPVFVEETVDLITRLMPKLKTLYFVSGDDQFSRTKGSELSSYMTEKYPKIGYKELVSGALLTDDLIKTVDGLNPKTDAVIFSSWISYNSYSTSFVLMNSAMYLLEASKAPTFVIRDNGWIEEKSRAVGGCVCDEDQYYDALSKVVKKVLDGVPARDIPFNNISEPITKIDYQQLKYYGIDENLCPENVRFVNKAESPWIKYKDWILVGAFVVVIVVLLLIVGYMRQKVRYRELQIKELEITRRFISLVENMPIVYFRAEMVKDAMGKVVDLCVNFSNNNVSRLFKIANMESKMPIAEALPKTTPVLLSAVNTALQKGENEFEMVLDIWIGSYYAMHVAIDGENVDVFGVDISDTINYQFELERTNHDLERAKNDAETSERMKTEFIQNMSHEIRTPLNAICGFVEMLTNPESSKDLSDDDRQEFAKIISRNSDMLINLVNDVLEFSDLNSGHTKVDLGPVRVNELCRWAVSSVELRVAKGVKLTFESDVAEGFCISTDAKRVQQVLVNFLTNAIKHTESGSITLRFKGPDSSGWCEFSCTDTGEGVPADMADKIFERFMKLNSYKQGTGLGLAICKSVANILEGDVSLDTSYTNGARFVFRLKV